MIRYMLMLSFSAGLLFSCADMAAQKAQKPPKGPVPEVHSNLEHDENGFYIPKNDRKIYELIETAEYTLEQVKGSPVGTATGIDFNFQGLLNGTLYYGFVPYGDSKHPHPVYFGRFMEIDSGRASINIAQSLRGRYDMIGWEKSGRGTLGYRVVNESGNFLYDGLVSFEGTGPFTIDITMIEGPFINLLGPNSATISFTLNIAHEASVRINGDTFSSDINTLHEIPISGLEPDKTYDYAVLIEENEYNYQLKTAPLPGARKAFTFSYASDSRSGSGGGERDIWGANSYIMKRIMAMNIDKQVSFMQFSGDLINGYETRPEAMQLQYANWKRAIQPFAHYLPVYVSMGNHEALNRLFISREDTLFVSLDRFPYETESSEVIFAQNFVNPTNGPVSEDGAYYDPNKKVMDFPTYQENVFYYTYDNVAVVVLNSDYWYSPSTRAIRMMSGGVHGYIMDNQVDWLAGVLQQLEEDENIDHIFVTQHTPFFPNGGHVGDDMWYNGNNAIRPYVAGKAVEKGIIQRRDELLDLLVNKSSKVIAILTGDEHNYARTEIGPNTVIHPEVYLVEKVELSRTIYQINNGAAGAPYYAQEQTPWTPFVTGFTTQNALVLFHVDGESLKMEVFNPDTLEKFDEFTLR